MLKFNASDLHLGTGYPPFIRVNGDMRRLDMSPLSEETVMKLIKEIMPPHNLEEYEKRHDTDFAYEMKGLARFRVNVFTDINGPGAVFRLIPSKIMTVEDLNLSKEVIDLCYLSKGLVLVTGPTGSGKSTTLAAMIDFVNRVRSAHIITIEDPIEFVHENKKSLINQREVVNHTISFKTALRAALREDPNVLLIGELRDLETMEIALETAETGHLVFGTLHTNDAPSTIERLIEQFPASKQDQIRQMLSGSLKGVLSQTLLKRKDGQGRIVAMEVLISNMAVANLIREGKTHQLVSCIQTGGKFGMISLNDALLKLVVTKVVSPEEAYLKAVSKNEFEKSQIGRASCRERV